MCYIPHIPLKINLKKLYIKDTNHRNFTLEDVVLVLEEAVLIILGPNTKHAAKSGTIFLLLKSYCTEIYNEVDLRSASNERSQGKLSENLLITGKKILKLRIIVSSENQLIGHMEMWNY